MRNIYGGSTPLIPINYAEALIDLAIEKGATKQSLLANTGIEGRLLGKANVRISYEQYSALIDNALRDTHEPKLGLLLGQRLDIDSHGVLGKAAQSSPNLWTAMGLILRFYKTRYPVLTLSFRIEDQLAYIQAEEAIHLGKNYSFIMETTFSSIYNVAQDLSNEKQFIEQLSLKYDGEKYGESYPNYFQAPVRFNQATNHVCVPIALLQKAIGSADAEIVKEATEQCSSELEPLVYQEGLITRVRQIMLQIPGYFPKLDEVADQLHTSSRTLRRRLQDAGISYQKILDDIRREKALHYLMTGEQSIEKISVLLDYKDPSNFSRAFKKWTGRTPGSYRKRYTDQTYG